MQQFSSIPPSQPTPNLPQSAPGCYPSQQSWRFRPVFTHRLATEADLPAIRSLMDLAIAEHLKAFLDPAQVELSKSIMGLDTQLIADRTYFLVEEGDRLAGCGGWSRRATLYGGDHSTAQRDAALLDMAKDAARIRAMYTHPDFARRGVGRLILDICESAARDAGFSSVELMATMSGEPLYRACGYHDIQRITAASRNGVDVPGVRMGKTL
ncbi:MAG: GNAT family N-acetyltransferase [Rhodobacterales bacterium 12-64-8]|nr:MAG: GNAT family N-acetyltransferase [Rhodobacterales bacterium 12-64-8]